MTKMKADRLERERRELIVRRKLPAINVLRDYKISRLPWSELMPEPIDFCNLPEIKAVLELPSEVDVQESSFADVIPSLPMLMADWAQGIKAKMSEAAQPPNIYSNSYSSPGCSDGPDLDDQNNTKKDLATTVFRCTDCYSSDGYSSWWTPDVEDSSSSSEDDDALMYPLTSNYSELLFYPKVMGHRCLTSKADFPWNITDPSIELNSEARSRRQWTESFLVVDETAGTAMADIIKTCSLDPTTTTVRDMDELDPWLGCSKCAKWANLSVPNAEVKVFGWRAAVSKQVLFPNAIFDLFYHSNS